MSNLIMFPAPTSPTTTTVPEPAAEVFNRSALEASLEAIELREAIKPSKDVKHARKNLVDTAELYYGSRPLLGAALIHYGAKFDPEAEGTWAPAIFRAIAAALGCSEGAIPRILDLDDPSGAFVLCEDPIAQPVQVASGKGRRRAASVPAKQDRVDSIVSTITEQYSGVDAATREAELLDLVRRILQMTELGARAVSI
jgi:hypothetical protein